ncbi:hypothetical protein D9C01_13865, partial [Corynebacterium diphtheriae]
RTVFALLAVLGLVASAMVVFGVGPSWILDKSIGASGRWRTSTTRTVFALLAVLGLVASAMVVFGVGPSWILDKSIG